MKAPVAPRLLLAVLAAACGPRHRVEDRAPPPPQPPGDVVDAGAAPTALDADPPRDSAAPRPTRIAPTAEQRIVLVEIERTVRWFSRDIARSELYQRLGRHAADAHGTSEIASSRVGIERFFFAGPPDRAELEIRLSEPVTLELLAFRFGAFTKADDGREPSTYVSPTLQEIAHFEVTISVTATTGDAPIVVLHLRRQPANYLIGPR